MKYLSVSIVKVGSSVKFKSTSESAVHSHIYTHCLSCVSCNCLQSICCTVINTRLLFLIYPNFRICDF